MRKSEKFEELDEQRAEALQDQVLKRMDAEPNQKRYDELADYMAQLRKYPVLKEDAAYARLFDWYRNGETEAKRQEARDLLVYGNIKLVLSIALRYTGRGLPLLDMMQEGVFGLMTAIEKFDISRGFRFSTMATWWIRQAITRSISDIGETRPYRIPVHMEEKIQMVKKVMAEFMKEHGHWPNQLEIYEGVKTLKTEAAAKLQLHEVAECYRFVVFGSSSLDEPIDENDDNREYGEITADPFPRTETVVEARRLLEDYQAALSRIEESVAELDPRSAMIVRLRFGMSDFDPMTLDEIGQRYDITRERVRQLEVKALEILEARIGVTGEQITELVDVIEELAELASSVL